MHMLAAGNMLAVFVSSNFLIEPNLFLVFISLVFALIIAFSRYSEGSHTIPQLILGIIIGFFTQVFSCFKSVINYYIDNLNFSF